MVDTKTALKVNVEPQRMKVTVKGAKENQLYTLKIFGGDKSRFASCAQVDAYIQEGNKCPPVRTDTFLVYAAPGERLGKQIKFVDQVFNVPKKYQNLVDCALVLSYSKVWIENGGEPCIKGHVIKEIEIPRSDGWYEDIDADTGILKGKASSSANPNARYWYRRTGLGADGRFMGAVVRADDPLSSTVRRAVYAIYGPDIGFGVALLEPAEPVHGKLLRLETKLIPL